MDGGELKGKKNVDKLDVMLEKWQKETREEIQKKGDESFNFLTSAPVGLQDRIKENTRQFVEEEWSKVGMLGKAKAIMKQFKTNKNPYNLKLKEQPTFIMKTRRVQYVFEKFRLMPEEPRTITEFADVQLVGEVRFWATKYVCLSYLLAANITFFAYHIAFKHLRKYVGLPLTFALFFVSRNLIMRNCMDRVYWPLEPVYNRIRGDEKAKKLIPAPEASPEDLKKVKEMTAKKAELSAEEMAEAEVNQEKAFADKKLEEYIQQVHGRFINEDDFEGETMQQKKEAYQKFINLYIALYYEPLDEELDEARYLTKDFSENLFKKLKYSRSQRKIKSLQLK